MRKLRTHDPVLPTAPHGGAWRPPATTARRGKNSHALVVANPISVAVARARSES
ncbi:hypothetical protein [Micromonospora olivasterospora]|uniref:Uncharacterized protein n=1 Tax=Micromonospora olivasterospora TaxID=1880 RepID=A0A562IIL8_MICOL|nr:hypothetical protein JD77_05590 [Micromonospora olivasterospora]